MLKKIIIFSVFAVTQLDAASQLTHAYLAKKWLVLNNKSEDYKAAFTRGTLFPDIRYYANVSRELTHEDNVTLQAIAACPDAFIAGKKFHSFVDQARWKVAIQIGSRVEKIVKKKAPVLQKHTELLLKFAEDDVIFANNDQCTEVAGYLGPIDEPMRAINIPDKQLIGWYNLLKAWYFSGSTMSSFYKQEFFQQSRNSIPLLSKISEEELNTIPGTIQALARDKQVQAHAKKLVRHFDKLFKKFMKEQKA